MPVRERYTPKPLPDREHVPFDTAEEAWFWFIQAHDARMDGARIVAGVGVSRPCEPVDIFKVMEKLYRAQKLSMEHVLTLRCFGRRMMPPDPRRPKESRAHKFWCEALELMEEGLVAKGIVAAARPWFMRMDPDANSGLSGRA